MLILKITKMILLYLLVFFSSTAHQQANSWHGIIPLRSTRADVEKLLGPPSPYSKALYAAAYKTENERVSVLYSTGPCDVEPSHGWNIPRGTVISIDVEPDVKLKFADLKLDESKYKKVRDPEIPQIVSYTSEKDGVSIEVDMNEGVVTTFRYSPMSKDNHLLCSPRTSNSSQLTAFRPRKIDEYSEIPFSSEKKRLDSFAKQLLNDSTSQGYIFAYAGRRACLGEAIRLAKRAKNYLVNKHDISGARLTLVDSGYRERWAIELYVVPLGTVMSPATPTVEPDKVQIIKNCNSKAHKRRPLGRHRS